MAVTINIPSQVKTYANLAAFPASGSLKTIYIAEDTNKTYRWTGSVYVEISASAAMTWGQIGGTLSNQTDLQNALDAKVPTTRTLTINGTTQDLSANRTFTIPTDLTVGTTPIASGTIGRVLFQGTGNVLQQSANLFWDDAANRFIIGGGTASNVRANTNEFNIQRDGLTVPTNGNQLMFNLVGSGQGMSITNQNGTTYRIGQFAASNVLTLGVSGNSTLNLFTSGNVAINTTTDAGFRLDVNGTARVQGSTTIVGTSLSSFSVSNGATAMIQTASSGIGSSDFRFRLFNNGNTQTLDLYGSGDYDHQSRHAFRTNGTERMRIFSTGNVLINTTTDAGYKLDVNGTARVNNDFTIGSNRYLKAFRWTQDDVTKSLQLESNSNFNVDSVNVISLNNSLLNNTKNFINIGLSSTVGTQSSGSTDAFNVLNIIPTYNMPFGTHTIKGIYYNPTLTAMVGTTHHAFHSTSGRIRFEGLPTSSAGLSAGDIWNDGGTLKIV